MNDCRAEDRRYKEKEPAGSTANYSTAEDRQARQELRGRSEQFAGSEEPGQRALNTQRALSRSPWYLLLSCSSVVVVRLMVLVSVVISWVKVLVTVEVNGVKVLATVVLVAGLLVSVVVRLMVLVSVVISWVKALVTVEVNGVKVLATVVEVNGVNVLEEMQACTSMHVEDERFRARLEVCGRHHHYPIEDVRHGS